MSRKPFILAAAIVAVLAAPSPAVAAPAPEPMASGSSIWTCPTRVDAVAAALRRAGFSAQAAKNAAIATQRECTHEPPD